MEFYGVLVPDWLWKSTVGFCVFCLLYLMSTQNDKMKGNGKQVEFLAYIGCYTGSWILMHLAGYSLGLYDLTQDFYRFLRGTWFPDYWMIPASWAASMIEQGNGMTRLISNLLAPLLFIGGWAVSVFIGFGPIVLLAAWAQHKENQAKG